MGKGNLHIIGIQEADEGTYQCRAENREDSADASAYVSVQGKPKIYLHTSYFQN